MLVTGNDSLLSDELLFNVNSSPFTSLFSSTTVFVVSNVTLVLIASGILIDCPDCILTVFIVLADHDDLSAAFTYSYA